MKAEKWLDHSMIKKKTGINLWRGIMNSKLPLVYRVLFH